MYARGALRHEKILLEIDRYSTVRTLRRKLFFSYFLAGDRYPGHIVTDLTREAFVGLGMGMGMGFREDAEKFTLYRLTEVR